MQLRLGPPCAHHDNDDEHDDHQHNDNDNDDDDDRTDHDRTDNHDHDAASGGAVPRAYGRLSVKALVTLLDRNGDHVGIAELDYVTGKASWTVPGTEDIELAGMILPDGQRVRWDHFHYRTVCPGDRCDITVNVQQP